MSRRSSRCAHDADGTFWGSLLHGRASVSMEGARTLLQQKKAEAEGGASRGRRRLPSFVLYVARDVRVPTRHDIGSVLCMRLVQTMAGVAHVDVREVSSRKRDASQTRPAWLTGTPTLVDEAEGGFWTGHDALFYLQELLSSHVWEREGEERGATQEEEGYATRQGGGGGGGKQGREKRAFAKTTAPVLQLRPDRSEKRGHGRRGEEEEEEAIGRRSEEEDDDLWSSRVQDVTEDVTEGGEEGKGTEETRKLSSDDLSEALRRRATALPPSLPQTGGPS